MNGPSLPLDDVTGIILAGGRSSRFGSDKLSAELDGQPLLVHAIRALGSIAERIVVVVAPGAELSLPDDLTLRVSVIHDTERFGGPLVGLAAALRAVGTPTALVAGGDMPRMVPAVLRRLAVTASPGRPAVILDVPGRVQPLPMAVDAAAALHIATAILGRDGRSLRELLRELGATSIPAPVWLSLDPTGATIVDIDRPPDLARIGGRCPDGAPPRREGG